MNAKEYEIDKEYREQMKTAFGFDKSILENKKMSDEYKIKNLDIEDKSTIFYDKTVVFTGDLDGVKREVAAEYIHSKGGLVRGSISSKTDIVIIGSIKPGPEKLKKLEELIASGINIQKVSEVEFFKISRLK
jgi:NAD-dependent DNA ligase